MQFNQLPKYVMIVSPQAIPCNPVLFPIPRLNGKTGSESMTPGQPGNGKTGQGFIQNVSVGVGKMMRTHNYENSCERPGQEGSGY